MSEEARERIIASISRGQKPADILHGLRRACAAQTTQKDREAILDAFAEHMDVVSEYGESGMRLRRLKLGTLAEDWEIVSGWVNTAPSPRNQEELDRSFLPALIRLWRLRVDRDPDDYELHSWVTVSLRSPSDPQGQTPLRLFAVREIVAGGPQNLREDIAYRIADYPTDRHVEAKDRRDPLRVLYLLGSYTALRSPWADKVVATFAGSEKTLHLRDPQNDGATLCGASSDLERVARGEWALHPSSRCPQCENSSPYDLNDPDLIERGWDEEYEEHENIFLPAAVKAAEETLAEMAEVEAHTADEETIGKLSEIVRQAEEASQEAWSAAVADHYADQLSKRYGDEPREAWRALQASSRTLRDYADQLPDPTKARIRSVLIRALVPAAPANLLAFSMRRAADAVIGEEAKPPGP